jgi:integrase
MALRGHSGLLGEPLEALRASKVRSLAPETFVFGSGARPLGSMELHRARRRVLTAAKVRYRAAEHLRHTLASATLSRNALLLYVQQQGGWRSASVLLRVNAHWMPPDGGMNHSGTTIRNGAAAAAVRGRPI